MPDILHDVPVEAPIEKVFEAISTPGGLDQWWTKRSRGTAKSGETFELWFGPEYDWRGRVSACVQNRSFELVMTSAMDDWMHTKVGFELMQSGKNTLVRFSHKGWPVESDHFRTSSYCWAMYLRIMKRYVERGETVEYEKRLEV